MLSIGRSALLSTRWTLVFFSSSSLVDRRELCRRFRDELKYDVISLDYRGFGDSSGEATEAGLVKDVHFVYHWLQTRTNGRRRIYLWGHSLGAAVACQVAAQLSAEQSKHVPLQRIHSLVVQVEPWLVC